MGRVLCLLLVSLALVASEADERYAKLRELLRVPGCPWTIGDLVRDVRVAEKTDPRLAPSKPGGQRLTDFEDDAWHRNELGNGFTAYTQIRLGFVPGHPADVRRFASYAFLVPDMQTKDVAELMRLKSGIEALYGTTIPSDGKPVTVDEIEFSIIPIEHAGAGKQGTAITIVDHRAVIMGRAVPAAAKP
jgi:hypothetical protein